MSHCDRPNGPANLGLLLTVFASSSKVWRTFPLTSRRDFELRSGRNRWSSRNSCWEGGGRQPAEGPVPAVHQRMRRPVLFRKRTVLLPTWPLSLLVLAAAIGLLTWAVFRIHSFLAPTRPAEKADLLVVEGWMPDYNLPRVVEDFREGAYQRIAVTGIALDKGSYLQEFKSYGDVTAATLKKMGIEDGEIVVGATTDTLRHRTYTAAVALRRAVDDAALSVESLNVYSQAAHARRTWMVFRKVFGDDVEIGIVALPTQSYDPDQWWASSAGIKSVGMESIALCHEWLFDSGRSSPE